jgi:hypothetical protein
MILDRYFFVERQHDRPGLGSKLVDPLVSCNRSDPSYERPRGNVRVTIYVDGKKCVLPCVLVRRAAKPPCVVAT